MFGASHFHSKTIIDASNTEIEAVLEQFLENKWIPTAYFSKKLNTALTKYSTFDKKLLAIYESIRHFRYLIEGRSLTIFTDHKQKNRRDNYDI